MDIIQAECGFACGAGNFASGRLVELRPDVPFQKSISQPMLPVNDFERLLIIVLEFRESYEG